MSSNSKGNKMSNTAAKPATAPSRAAATAQANGTAVPAKPKQKFVQDARISPVNCTVRSREHANKIAAKMSEVVRFVIAAAVFEFEKKTPEEQYELIQAAKKQFVLHDAKYVEELEKQGVTTPTV